MRTELPRPATCLIVGASSGIGLATAVELAAQGHHLRLVSRDADALDRAARQCTAAGAASVRTAAADVNDRAQLGTAIDTALGDDDVHFVVHTATVMGYGRLEDLPETVFRAVVDTAVHGTMNLAHAVLPRLRAQGQGIFVVVNSLLGSITVPGMGAYSVSKWGQRAVARTLQQELRGARGVRLCIASPGSINTPIYYQAANYLGRAARPPIPVLQPERAGRVLAALLRRPRNHVSIPIGPGNPLVIFGYRFLPWLFDRIVTPAFRLAALRRKEPTSVGTVFAPDSAAERMRGRWPEPKG